MCGSRIDPHAEPDPQEIVGSADPPRIHVAKRKADADYPRILAVNGKFFYIVNCRLAAKILSSSNSFTVSHTVCDRNVTAGGVLYPITLYPHIKSYYRAGLVIVNLRI